MSLINCFRVALRALGRNKLRSGLTMLGIVIGVAAVLTMIGVGNGAQASVTEEVQSTGTTLIDVKAGNYTRPISSATILEAWEFAVNDPTIPRDPDGRGSATTLTPEDAHAIKEKITGVKWYAPAVTERTFVLAGAKRHFTRVEGTDVAFPEMHSWTLVQGRFFDQTEVISTARVAVLGEEVSRRLFDQPADAIGKPIELRGERFTVIGISASEVRGQSEWVYVPFTTLQTLLGISHLHGITVAAENAGDTMRISDEITLLLRDRHGLDRMLPEPELKLGVVPSTIELPPELQADDEGIILPTLAPPKVPDDFTVRPQAASALVKGLTVTATTFVLAQLPQLENITKDELQNALAQATNVMTALLASIAGVSLFVGGIGIMNIMMVSVTERTQEIGVRMTVGARQRDVLLQFLVEAVTLSLLGGLIGIALGFVASGVVTRVMGWETYISLASVFLAFGIAVAIGIFFGFYPARRASRLDPIVALRYE